MSKSFKIIIVVLLVALIGILGYMFWQSKSSVDSDNDGLSDFDEIIYNSDSNNPDTDGDGLSDGDEIILGSNIKEREIFINDKYTLCEDGRIFGNYYSYGHDYYYFIGSVIPDDTNKIAGILERISKNVQMESEEDLKNNLVGVARNRDYDVVAIQPLRRFIGDPAVKGNSIIDRNLYTADPWPFDSIQVPGKDSFESVRTEGKDISDADNIILDELSSNAEYFASFYRLYKKDGVLLQVFSSGANYNVDVKAPEVINDSDIFQQKIAKPEDLYFTLTDIKDIKDSFISKIINDPNTQQDSAGLEFYGLVHFADQDKYEMVWVKLSKYVISGITDKQSLCTLSNIEDGGYVDTYSTQDTDNDGLPDVIESMVTGTGIYKSDSDCDGYTDGDEIKNGFPPNSPMRRTIEKLKENGC